MLECKHLMFGRDNFVELDSTILTATPAPVTDINFLKNTYPARVAKWTNLQNDIVIEGVTDGQVLIDYFAIPGNNLNPNATIQLELFENATDATPIYTSGETSVGDLIPLGAWRAGIDEYGNSENAPLSSVRSFWFTELKTVGKFRLTISHGFTYTPAVIPAGSTATPPTVTTTTVSDGIFRQGTNGVLSIEAESGVVTNDAGIDTWAEVTDSDASGGKALYKNQDDFYNTSAEGPRVDFEFTASQSGSNDIYVRLKSSEGNSAYFIFDGQWSYVYFDMSQPFVWKKLARHVVTVAEQRHQMSIAARDHFVYFDKIVIQPSGAPAPSGTGPAESGTGTKTITTVDDGGDVTEVTIESSDSVELRMIMMGNSMTMEGNFTLGGDATFVTPPDLHYSSSGSANITRPQHKKRRIVLPLNNMTEIDRFNLRNMEATLLGKPFLVNAYPDHPKWLADDYMFLGRFATANNYQQRTRTKHRTTIEIVEV